MAAVLGVSAHYHDAAAALVVGGEVVAAAQEERFSRIKHDPALPVRAMCWCLESAGLAASDLDAVVYYEKPLRKLDRILETHLALAPRGLGGFLDAMPLWLGRRLFVPEEIADALAGFRGKLLCAEHHASHAASAFLPSPFDEAAILTLDGVGEWATGSFGVGRGSTVETWEETRFPHSLGLLYAAFTAYLGFEVNEGEYKVMGLAPYGEPRHEAAILGRLVHVADDGSVHLDVRRLGFLHGTSATSRSLERLLGAPARKPGDPLTDHHRDVARSIQGVCEEAILRQARHVRSRTGLDRLCLAGGVALNAVANGRLLREGSFHDVWVQPAATDAGGALGAALLGATLAFGEGRRAGGGRDAMRAARLGPTFSAEAIRFAVARAGLVAEEPPDIARAVAERLERGEVVGLFAGAMELGPRALGGRSILADPRRASTKDDVNRRIKFREGFRPFAPSVLADRAPEAYEVDRPLPYMTIVVPVRPEARDGLAAVTHVDGTARIQTVAAGDHPELGAVLEEFRARTGCASLLQTSFNLAGEPIVCTPDDALRTFLRSGMDALAMPPCLVVAKEGGREPSQVAAAEPRRPAWRRALRRVAAIQMAFLLALVFFLVLTPLALVARLLGRDPLRLRNRAATGFVPRSAVTLDARSLEKRG